jgi:tripartite motif-containing protein 71
MIARVASWWSGGIAVAAVVAAAAVPAAQAAEPTTFGDAPGALRLPEAVAVTGDGDVLVGDHFSGRVQRFRDGKPVSAFGLRGEGCGRLGAVAGIAVDDAGNTYVLDTDQQLVQVFDRDGVSTRCFGGRGNGAGKLRTGSGSYAASSASGGIAVAGGYVYVADAGNDRVQRFTLAGQRPKILGQGKLKLPQGLAVKGTRLLVADDGNHRVVELTTSGRFVKATSEAAGVKLRFPYDVAFDADGGAYVADNNLHRIVQLDTNLKRVRAWGSEGHGNGELVFPRAVAVQADGHLLVADAGNDRVQELTATGGFVRTIGRNGRATPHVTQPADVAVNAFGEVAVADGNGRISWFDLAGGFAGAWAQSRSFQQSTAVVVAPKAIDFGADPRAPRVADGGDVRVYADRALRRLLASERGTAGASAIDVGPSGATWAVQGTGRFARVADAGASGGAAKPVWLGTRSDPGRTTTAIAELAEGGVAIAEGTSPHQTDPADGTVARRDAVTGRLLASWAIPRPAGGQPSRPAGLAATPDGGAWVADAANDRLLRLAPDGSIAQQLGAPGTLPGQLAEPRGLELDCAGGLLVADSGNNRIVRYPDVTAPAPGGCRAAAAPTAEGRPPAPVGLRIRTRTRASRPAARLGTIAATCTRACVLKVDDASASVLGRGRVRSHPVTATVTGKTIILKASATTVAALRAAARDRDAVTVGVLVTATAKDGVVDTASASWRFGG